MYLTDITIRNLKPAQKARKYADGEGLFLYVTVNGVKSWRFRYRDVNGKEKEMTFGIYPEVSLLEAREKRFEARKLIQSGRDPLLEKKKNVMTAKIQLSNTFKSVADEWHELNTEKWSARHANTIKYRLEDYLYPVLGNIPVSEISSLDILAILRGVEKKGKYELCHRLLQYASSIFRLAVLTQRADYNPCNDLKRVLKVGKVKHHPTIRIEELPELLNRLEMFKTSELNKLAIKMLMLTFVRQGELRRAKWEHFNLEKKIWCIPAELMKMRKEHIVPLSNQAIEVLHKIHRISGGRDYLFPTKNRIKHPYMNENTINKVLQNIGYKGRLVGHGFRSLASTTLNELGYSADVIEKQLAHEERNQVRAAYNRAEYLSQRFELMQGWADYIDGITIEEATKTIKIAA